MVLHRSFIFSLYYIIVFCPVDDNRVIKCSCKKKLKLPFRKSKLQMQCLSYVGPITWNNFPNHLKNGTTVNCFKHDIRKCFLKKLSETEADIHSYI